MLKSDVFNSVFSSSCRIPNVEVLMNTLWQLRPPDVMEFTAGQEDRFQPVHAISRITSVISHRIITRTTRFYIVLICLFGFFFDFVLVWVFLK